MSRASAAFWAGDAIATAIEANTAAKIHQREMQNATEQHAALVHRWNELVDKFNALASTNAANLAEKNALRVALERLDPKHPLLVDEMLKKRVQDLGERAFAINNSFNDAARAGRNVKY